MALKHEFIIEMKEALLKEQKELEREISASSNFPDYGRNDEDNATEIADYQVSLSTEVTLKDRLYDVLEALERIKQGTYGITTDGTEIPPERLRANPAAKEIVK